MTRASGTGSLTMGASATQPAMILVEDIRRNPIVSRRVFNGGAVVEEWDDAARLYRRFIPSFLERPYTG